MASICILTGSHLCRNPRVVKEASSLSEAGYEVTVLGPLISEELADEDEKILRGSTWTRLHTLDLRANYTNYFNRLTVRLKRRLSGEAIRWLGWESSFAFGYGVEQTLAAAKRSKHDLYIAHQELGSWVGYKLASEGRRVGADLEDWYSRDLLPEAQALRPRKLLEKCERFFVSNCRHVTTTSHALASALATSFNAPPPLVIYNSFPWDDRASIDFQFKDKHDRSAVSLHWFSQTIGEGRGLETLCAALHKVENPVEVHLRGSYISSTEAWLQSLFPQDKGHKLFLHKLVSPEELISRIAEHDIGLALELKAPESRNLTVTNKILHYLLAGVAVIAADTAGQQEVAATASSAISLYQSGDADSLAEKLNFFLNNPQELAHAKVAALEVAQNNYRWEKEVPKLLNSVEKAINSAKNSS